jgi:hypothetical protein
MNVGPKKDEKRPDAVRQTTFSEIRVHYMQLRRAPMCCIRSP